MSVKAIYGIQNIFSFASRERCMTNLKKLYIPKYGTAAPAATAAVVVPLCRVGDVPSLLYTVRSPLVNTNSGEVTFPGGKTEKGENPLQTALRETIEGIGLPPKRIDVWGEAPAVPERTNQVMVTPVIASIMDVSEGDFTVNTDKVSELFTVPIEMLCDPKHQYYTQFKSGFVMPVFTAEEYKIWGVTAYITHGFLSSILSKDVYSNEWMQKRIEVY